MDHLAQLPDQHGHTDDFDVTILDKIIKGPQRLYQKLGNCIGFANWHYIRIITVLAFLTLLLIPLNVLVNIFFSYRLDPAGFFSEHSGYHYNKNYTGGILAAWWVHKLSTMFWTGFAVLHMMIITCTGVIVPNHYRNRMYRLVHMCTGSGILFFSSTAAICGAIVMTQKDARYDFFTQWFLYMPMVLVIICVPLIAFDRLNVVVFGARIHKAYHAFFGCILVLPPLAMMIQFCTYSALVAVQNKSNDYLSWKISMGFSIVFGIISTFLFTFNAYFMAEVQKQAHGEDNNHQQADNHIN